MAKILHRAVIAGFLAAVVPLSLATSVPFVLLDRTVIENRLKSFSRDNSEREQTLKKFFADSGCTDHLSEQPVKHVKEPNLVCVLPAQSDRVIIVGAHFDHAHDGDGVIDNWSGSSLLPSLYQSLDRTPRRHTFLFIAFAAEEEGLPGSEAYVNHMTKEKVARTDAMINIDSLGVGPTEVWVSHADLSLVHLLAGVAQRVQLPLTGMNVEAVGSADSEQFARRKIPQLTVHSVTQKTLRLLHSSSDNLKAIRLDNYYDSYHLLAAYLAVLDNNLGETTPPAVPATK